MGRTPSAVWIVDTNKEHLAVEEARKLRIPIIGILDSNCDPDLVDYPIPGNDDAIRAVGLLTRVIADAVAEGLIARSGAKTDTAASGDAVGTEEPLAEWERELLQGDADKAAVAATGGDTGHRGHPGRRGHRCRLRGARRRRRCRGCDRGARRGDRHRGSPPRRPSRRPPRLPLPRLPLRRLPPRLPRPAETAEAPATDVAEGEFGAGSAAPLESGEAPAGFEIKGNKTSKKFHAPSSPWYDRTNAEVWFRTAEAAEAAGFVNAEAKADEKAGDQA